MPGLWLGLAAAVALFALEGGMLLRKGAIGVGIDVDSPAIAAIIAAVRPAVTSVLARIAVVYLVGGLLLGAAAEVLARLWRPGRPTWRGAALELAVLFGLLCVGHAIARPALFDDVPFAQGLLGLVVDRGEPWHVWLAAGTWLALHGVKALRRGEVRSLKASAGLAALLAVSVLSLRWRSAPPPAPAKLVVLLGIDAFRPDRLTALGSPRVVAPHLESLLADATLFERAYTPIAQTEPAWRSLLTGRWPHRTGVRYPLTADARWALLPTFPTTFGAAGYTTAFFTDCSRFNFQGPLSGFTERVQPPRGALNFALEKLRFRGVGLFADNRVGAWWLPELVDNRAVAGIHDPMGYAQRLGGRMAALAAKGPALLAFHATAAHFPGDPVYPFYRRYVDTSAPLSRRLRMFFSPIAGAASSGTAPAWDRRAAEGLYDELLAQADAQLGLVLDALKADGLYDQATIVVFSDHGESFHADHPELASATPVHGARLSEEENRILFAVKLPGGRAASGAPAKVDALVRLLDIGPTVLELAGLPALPAVDGESLVPALRGQPLRPLRLYAETGFSHASPEVFDPGHASGAPRSVDAYRVRPDGTVETGADAHDAILAEKDVGAFDGERWLVRAPRAAGGAVERCAGDCGPGADALRAWLDGLVAP